MQEVTLLAWQVACGVGVLLLCAAAAVWGLCREHTTDLLHRVAAMLAEATTERADSTEGEPSA